jgi:hypothetical protein
MHQRIINTMTIIAAVATMLLGNVAPALAFGPQLTRYPYLTDVVDTNATINWATNTSATTGYATYGLVGQEACTAHRANGSKTSITVGSTGEYQWKAKVTGLTANAQYCYRVFFSNPTVDLLGTDAAPVFTTPVAAGASDPFTFAVMGDWGAVDATGANPDQANLMRQLAASGARFVVGAGDTAYSGGTQTNYGDLYQTGANVSTVFGPNFYTKAGSSMSMFEAPGNHGFNSTFFNVWPGSVAPAASGGKYQVETYCCTNGTNPGNYPSAWYAFTVGQTRIYVLTAAWANSNVGTASVYKNDFDNHWQASSPEYQWLQADLAAHPGEVKIAAHHLPMYSDNATETTDTYLHGPGSLAALFGQYGVKMVFNGHAHIYQRNNPVAGEGFVSYVTGGGGAALESVSQCGAYDGYAIGWSPSSNKGNKCGGGVVPDGPSRVFHFLKVSVAGRTVTVTPTDELGRTFDVQTYSF